MFSVLLLFLPLQSLGQPQCGEFTMNDMEGPFYEPNAPKSYELAPQDELNDPREAVILKGQVLDCSCKGIGGALVEVWYAGGNPGLPKSLSAIGVAFHTYSLIVLLSWLGASCHPVTL